MDHAMRGGHGQFHGFIQGSSGGQGGGQIGRDRVAGAHDVDGTAQGKGGSMPGGTVGAGPDDPAFGEGDEDGTG